ncbi:ABC transporter ATP-binding protein [Aquidulcibacter sp.]|uniref:ABC transporter ATP-binding protein n=1 Tax=Aquidulcibacter sp. TaxID=2052990 RepID=UPI0025BED852|nr:ABC transporter ATP-binding protein [Aquidulcibacter sp.]MCA3695835.1 ABC transporter ATP-binding protein [Aquidulcibacter sp.]
MSHVTLSNVSVSYPLFMSSGQRSVLAKAAKILSFGGVRSKAGGQSYVDALINVSINLQENARIGLIGRNGSGKSTLLKVLAGVNLPTRGRRDASGQVATMLSTMAGLGPEKTGRQNVRLMCDVFALGASRTEEIIEDIEEFTQLGQFFDLPVLSYSAGMQVRLAFALSTCLPGDMLFIDEALGAGDAQFLERAAARLAARMDKAKILAIATHSPADLERFCDCAIWMDRGRIVEVGDPMTVWANYSKFEITTPPNTNIRVTWPPNAKSKQKFEAATSD